MGIEGAPAPRPQSAHQQGNGPEQGLILNAVTQLEPSGIPPLDGCNTKAGPQQQDGQR